MSYRKSCVSKSCGAQPPAQPPSKALQHGKTGWETPEITRTIENSYNSMDLGGLEHATLQFSLKKVGGQRSNCWGVFFTTGTTFFTTRTTFFIRGTPKWARVPRVCAKIAPKMFKKHITVTWITAPVQKQSFQDVPETSHAQKCLPRCFRNTPKWAGVPGLCTQFACKML